MLVLVPLAVGLKVKDTVQCAPTSMVRPQLLAWAKSEESLPAMVKPETVIAARVLLVMTTLAGTLSVPTSWTGKKIVVRERPTFGTASAGDEACHQVAEPVGASEFFQLEGTPEPSRAVGSTPSVS